MIEFQVSVVIPIYNAANFVDQAVQSALNQPETTEVILVEDHSLDNSLEICKMLASKFDKVYLFQHPHGANRGAGPSRNLGIKKSKCGFIAFLDADDYYLPGRFTATGKVFNTHLDCDGVYEAVGIRFEDEQSKQRWLASSMAPVQITTIQKKVTPEELFRVLIKGGSGHIHLNGLVIKRSILDKTGYMSDEIADTLHEDTDFILKLAAVGNLLPGTLNEPVALRRAHGDNRVSATRSAASVYRDHMRQRVVTYRWCKNKGLQEQRKLAFWRMMLECVREKPYHPVLERFPSFVKTTRLLTWLLEVPDVLFEGAYWLEVLRSIWGGLKYPNVKNEIL